MTSTVPEPTLLPPPNLTHRFFPPYVRLAGRTVNAVARRDMPRACRLTMGLLSVALRKRVKPHEYRMYAEGRVRPFQVDKMRFYAYAYGQGPKVLLPHGWCSHAGHWADYVAPLVARGYCVVTVDAPGHGLAPGRFLSVPNYIRCLRAVLRAADRWHGLLAHSMGSLAGVIAASEVGHAARGIPCVLMSTFSDCDALMSKFARQLGVSEEVLDHTRRWIDAYAGKPLPYFSLAEHLPRLGANVLLVADTQDVVVPTSEAERVRRMWPDTELMLTEGLGHNLRAEAVVERAVRFLDE